MASGETIILCFDCHRMLTVRLNSNPFGYQPWRDRRTFQVSSLSVLLAFPTAHLQAQGMFDVLEADIVVFQETKIQRKDLRDDMVLVPGWDCYFSLPRHKKGWSISARAKCGARLTNW
jgi:AP endonuclease-2